MDERVKLEELVHPDDLSRLKLVLYLDVEDGEWFTLSDVVGNHNLPVFVEWYEKFIFKFDIPFVRTDCLHIYLVRADSD